MIFFVYCHGEGKCFPKTVGIIYIPGKRGKGDRFIYCFPHFPVLGTYHAKNFTNSNSRLSSSYRWSSYGVKIGNRKEELLDYDPCYLGLADSEKKRAESYAAWVKETIAAEELELIRKSLQRGQLTGSPRFVDEIEQKIERRVEFRGPGRPRKVEK